MWPWESAAFAYLCYSLYTHFRHRESPAGGAVVIAAVASVLPDVIDKPLNWQFDVFSSGYALGHSVFFSLLVLAVAVAAARRVEHPRSGLAFGLGFLSHNVGDALEHMLDGHVWRGLEVTLWPLVTLHSRPEPGFSTTVRRFLGEYLSHLVHLEFTPYFGLVGAVLAATLALWTYDGFPPLGELAAAVRRRTHP